MNKLMFGALLVLFWAPLIGILLTHSGFVYLVFLAIVAASIVIDLCFYTTMIRGGYNVRNRIPLSGVWEAFLVLRAVEKSDLNDNE